MFIKSGAIISEVFNIGKAQKNSGPQEIFSKSGCLVYPLTLFRASTVLSFIRPILTFVHTGFFFQFLLSIFVSFFLLYSYLRCFFSFLADFFSHARLFFLSYLTLFSSNSYLRSFFFWGLFSFIRPILTFVHTGFFFNSYFQFLPSWTFFF